MRSFKSSGMYFTFSVKVFCYISSEMVVIWIKNTCIEASLFLLRCRRSLKKSWNCTNLWECTSLFQSSFFSCLSSEMVFIWLKNKFREPSLFLIRCLRSLMKSWNCTNFWECTSLFQSSFLSCLSSEMVFIWLKNKCIVASLSLLICRSSWKN